MMRIASAVLPVCLWLAAVAGQGQDHDPIGRSRAAIQAERPAEALQILRPLVERGNASAEAMVLLSTAHFMVGDLEAGRRLLDLALATDPGYRQAWLNRAALDMSEGRLDEALAALREAKELDPSAPDNDLNIGAVLVLKGDVGQASRHFNKYLAENRSSANAYYLVASNYAIASRWDLATQHLEAAIRLDERSRRRARVDPNFGPLGTYGPFQQLLTVDSFVPTPGSHQHIERFEAAYDGSRGSLLKAVLNAFQFTGQPFDPNVEVTEEWALVWSELRLKVSNAPGGGGQIEMSAPADRMSAADWDATRRTLTDEIRAQLAMLSMRRR
jgi:tetratricopeptide (TPR) repeat protein